MNAQTSSATPSAPAVPKADDLGAAARRGLVYIPMAKAWFLVAGLLLQLMLPRVLGSSALFGVWTLVLAWLSTPNNVMVTATIQAVAHFAAKGSVESAKRSALRMNLLVGCGTALGFFLLAPAIGPSVVVLSFATPVLKAVKPFASAVLMASGDLAWA